MNRGIYSTATGMFASQRWMDTIANNLANASTTGFKRDGLVFTDALARQLRAEGGMGRSLGSMGTGAVPAGEYTVFEPGPIQETENPLDVAIESARGLFAVETPQGVRYTRDGSFQLDENRQLVTKDGFTVLDREGRAIELPLGNVQIDAEGHVSANGQQIAQLGLFDGAFAKEGNNLFTSSNATPMDHLTLKAGALEGSNVNAVQAMIEMITIGRHFEMAQRNITQQDELTQKLIQSLQDR